MKTISTKSFWIKKSNIGYIKAQKIKPPKRNQVLIKTLYSGISYGTEKIIFNGKVPVNQVKAMKCPYQEGDFGKDVKYGYLNIGKIIKGDKKLEGKHIFSLFPHQNFYTLDKNDVITIPNNIPIKRCLLTANMETAINATWDVMPKKGDNIFIIGAGVVGLLLGYYIKSLKGISSTIVDKDKSKRKYAKHLGLKFKNNLQKNFKANIIYECTGDASILNNLAHHIETEGKICILSWYGNKKSNVSFGENFFSKRLKIIFSQVSKIPESHSKKWNLKSRRKFAIKQLFDDKLDILIEKNEIRFEELPKFFKNNINKNNFVCNIIKYE